MDQIMSYENREQLKQRAWEEFRVATTPHGKAAAMLSVIDAHYWRQREALEADKQKKKHLKLVVPKKYSPGYELDIDHYTPHWLHSMRHLVPEDVAAVLEDQWGYKATPSKYLPDGHTIYVCGARK